MQKAVTISHGFYQPYFYWMFPIIVAKEKNLFQQAGVDLKVHDIVGGGQPEDKAGWYQEALQTGSRDFYFCCAWQGIYSTSETGKGKIGAAIRSTLLKTFAIYTRQDGPVGSIIDLGEKGIPIAVNKNADAHYVTLKSLSEFLPSSKIKFAHLGGVERCLKGLMDGEVEAATLAGPYAEAAEALGYRRLLPLSRTEPTVIVFNDTLDRNSASLFIKALNESVKAINADRARYRKRYLKEFEQVVSKYLPDLEPKLPAILPRVSLPVWAAVKPMEKEEFEDIHSFLIEHGLSRKGGGYQETVDSGLLTVG